MKSAWLGLGVAIWLAGCAAAGGVDGVDRVRGDGGESGGSFGAGGSGGTGDEGGSGGRGGTGGSDRDGIPDSFVDAVTASLSGDARRSAEVGANGAAGQPAARASDPAGDPARGRALVADRAASLCLLCHRAPIPEVSGQGELGPDLAGAGRRFTRAELRRRLVDPGSFNPATLMPAYLRRDGLWRVAESLRGRSLLTAAEVDDVVAYLASLK